MKLRKIILKLLGIKPLTPNPETREVAIRWFKSLLELSNEAETLRKQFESKMIEKNTLKEFQSLNNKISNLIGFSKSSEGIIKQDWVNREYFDAAYTLHSKKQKDEKADHGTIH